MSKFSHHEACPQCGSSDGFAVYEDNRHCFVCSYHEGNIDIPDKHEARHSIDRDVTPLPKNDQPAIKERKIGIGAVNKYRVTVNTDLDSPVDHVYPYFDEDGSHVANKIRRKGEKAFYWEGDVKKGVLFGQTLFPPGGKAVTVVEGECFKPDAEVLTPQGWIAFSDYYDEDVYEVREDLSGGFVRPLAVVEKFYDGELITYSCRGYSSTTTPGHNMVALTQSKKLIKHRADAPTKTWNNIPRTSQYEGPGLSLSDAQIEFCVAVSADASFDLRKDGSTYVRISFKKSRKIEAFRQLVNDLGLVFIETIHKNGNTFFGGKLPEWSCGRLFPAEWFTQFSGEQRLYFLTSLKNWGGNSVPNRRREEYSSKYLWNAKFVQTMCHLSGFCSSVIERSNPYGSWYKVSLLWGKSETSWQSMTKSLEDYSGIVNCVSVPSGMILVRVNGKISVSGNCDALAGFQLTGSRYPCVSVKSASEAKRNCADNFEYLDSFEKIVICFDNDEPGQKAAQQVAQLFQPGKVHILKLAKAKDANDYLMLGLEKEYINEWFRAPTYMPDGLKIGSDMWDEIANHVTPKSVPYPWKGLNYMTYGIRLSEVVLLTADTGVGKTSIVKEIEYLLLTNPDLVESKAGVGILHLEEPNYDTLIGLMSVNANKPFHLPDTERTNKELREHFDAVINSDRVVIWDHFGSNDIDAVLSKIRHMAALGCKYIILDHLSIVVSDQSGDERKQLDEISTKLKMLCMNLDISVIAIIHINRQGQVRGSAGPEQIANIVIKLYRDKTDPDPWRRNITRLTVEKNRFCGRTGPACHLFYNEITGRLEELPKDATEAYEKGLSLAGSEFEMFSN